MIGVTFIIFLAVTVSNSADPQTQTNPKQDYAFSISDHIKKNWNYTLTPENKRQSVLVSLKIDRSGKILEKTIVNFSDEEKLNQEVLNQLTAMEPFHTMPAEMKEIAYIKFKHRFVPNVIKVNMNQK